MGNFGKCRALSLRKKRAMADDHLLASLGLDVPPSQEDIHATLREKWLTPKDSLPAHWLGRYQTCVDLYSSCATDTKSIPDTGSNPSISHPCYPFPHLLHPLPLLLSALVLTVESLATSRCSFPPVHTKYVVTHCMQTSRPRVNDNAQTSTSLLRAPAPTATFVRGKSGYLPFRPGGLDDVVLSEEPRAPASQGVFIIASIASVLTGSIQAGCLPFLRALTAVSTLTTNLLWGIFQKQKIYSLIVTLS